MKLIPTQTYHATTTFNVPVPIDRALRLLHNPRAFLSINTAVMSVVQDESDQQMWHITERIKTFAGNTSTSFKARISNTPSGFEAESWAALGVTTTSHWQLTPFTTSETQEAGSESTRFNVEGSVTAPFYLFAFVKSQWLNIHKDTGARMTKALLKDESEVTKVT